MDADLYVTLAASGLVGLGMMVAAGLTGWRDWLRLKGRELDARAEAHAPSPVGAGARIEIADLRERIRKLEAIAAGVEL